MKILERFLPFVAQYEGVGEFGTGDDRKDIFFEAVQIADGTLLVAGAMHGDELGWPAEPTIRGFTQDPAGEFLAENVTMSSSRVTSGMTTFTGRCSRFQFAESRIRDPSLPAEADLANLLFDSYLSSIALPPEVSVSVRGFTLRLIPVPEYRRAVEQLRASGGVAQTATCRIERTRDSAQEGPDERLFDSILLVVSLLTGTKVVWTSRLVTGQYGRPLRIHRASHSKPLTRELARLAWMPNLEDGLQTWIDSATENEEMTYTDQMIDFFLDALAHTDVETRALTAASLIDSLVGRWAEKNDVHRILAKNNWNPTKKAVKLAIQAVEELSRAEKAKIIAKLDELNRASFLDRLVALLAAMGLSTERAELVKDVRNELIHSGKFPAKVPSGVGYEILIGTAYAILLRMVGYRGHIPLETWGRDD
jgi:hypothetical protein